MKKDTTVIVPIRKGSQRVLKKNIRSIAGNEYGLTEIKLRQLIKTDAFDQILIDTDLDEIESVVDFISDGKRDSRIRIEVRAPHLAGSDATTDDLIKHLVTKVQTSHMVWTHVTSPFFTSECYQRFMTAYFDRSEEFDSLVTVDGLREFLWTKKGPLNYDRSKLRWPFTQTLEPVYLINSAAFAIPTDLASKLGDRLGDSPQFFECTAFEGFDVDWPAQFDVVDLLVKNGYPIL